MSKKDPLEGFGWDPQDLKNHQWTETKEDREASEDKKTEVRETLLAQIREALDRFSLTFNFLPKSSDVFRGFELKQEGGTTVEVRVEKTPLTGYYLNLGNDEEVLRFFATSILKYVEDLWEQDTPKTAVFVFKNNKLHETS